LNVVKRTRHGAKSAQVTGKVTASRHVV